MGQAKNRGAELVKWLDALNAEGRTVYDVALRTYERFVKVRGAGMCYRMTFFLTAYLAEHHGIRVEPVVGYVNDGTDDLMISHAWLELGGKKTDIAVAISEPPNIPGPLLIMDRALTRGRATYTYHRERSAQGELRAKEFLRDPRARNLIIHKEVEHARMTSITKDASAILPYLDAAPDGIGYRQLAGIIAPTAEA